MPDLIVSPSDVATLDDDATAILTLEEAQRAINRFGNTSADDDTDLTMYVGMATRAVEELIGPVVRRTITRTYYPSRAQSIELPVPVRSAEFTLTDIEVTEWTAGVSTVLTAETAASSTTNNFLFDPAHGLLYRRSSWSWGLWGVQQVDVSYVAGRAASTATVPAWVKGPARIIVKHLWDSQHGAASVTFGEQLVTLPSGFLVPNQAAQALPQSERLLPGFA